MNVVSSASAEFRYGNVREFSLTCSLNISHEKTELMHDVDGAIVLLQLTLISSFLIAGIGYSAAFHGPLIVFLLLLIN